MPRSSPPTCGQMEARNGGADLPRRGHRRPRSGDGQGRRRGAGGRGPVAGGVFETTKGLYERFGAERVGNTPISEQTILGCAMGAAMKGVRPVAEIMFSDFYATCWDLVVNEMAKARYMSGGQLTLPLVVRSANGGGTGFGAQHRTGPCVSRGSRSRLRRTRPTSRACWRPRSETTIPCCSSSRRRTLRRQWGSTRRRLQRPTRRGRRHEERLGHHADRTGSDGPVVHQGRRPTERVRHRRYRDRPQDAGPS